MWWTSETGELFELEANDILGTTVALSSFIIIRIILNFPLQVHNLGDLEMSDLVHEGFFA